MKIPARALCAQTRHLPKNRSLNHNTFPLRIVLREV